MRKAWHSWRRYFWEGQQLNDSVTSIPKNADFIDKIFIKHRKYIAFLMPFGIMQTIWWITAYRFNWFVLFRTRWQMPLVMFFGSTIAGMTSEGGGAVAFPVMTLLLQIDPSIARDFSLIIQSAGMTCAMCVVLIMQVKIEVRSIIFGTLGSVPGFVFGSTYLDAYLTSSQKKMLFVSIWSSFAIALFILNNQYKRKTYYTIPHFCSWKACILIISGFVGGVFTAFAGSGVDICMFSITTLLFRVSEKTATPTSVVLMGDVPLIAWEYVAVSIPVAVTMAPLGSFLGSHLHRQMLAGCIYVLETVALIGFLLTRPSTILILQGSAIIFMSFVLFMSIAKVGQKIIDGIESETEPSAFHHKTSSTNEFNKSQDH